MTIIFYHTVQITQYRDLANSCSGDTATYSISSDVFYTSPHVPISIMNSRCWAGCELWVDQTGRSVVIIGVL